MATLSKESRKVLEGIFAINKPQWSSSAGVLRDLQTQFASSALFAPWLESQKRALVLSYAKPKHIKNLKVKLGHGGTLDPMATGVLVVGVGKGTKQLGKYLECTKSYECVVLFGAATDSYDAVGKVVSKAPYEHVTRELVEEKLAQFRGQIMQKPSVFSALKVDGKKMYEYAREGKNIPEVAARPVEVQKLELVEWLEPGQHEFEWPKEQVEDEDMKSTEKILGIRTEDVTKHANTVAKGSKKRTYVPEDDNVKGAREQPKRLRSDGESAMSGAEPTGEDAEQGKASAQQVDDQIANEPKDESNTNEVSTFIKRVDTSDPQTNRSRGTRATNALSEDSSVSNESESTSPPAARLRMTVTSGFYVRSLCYDLGLACSSLALMSSLIRTRQGSHQLGKNVLEWSDLEAGIETWEPKLQRSLEEFMKTEGWDIEELQDEETWKAKQKEAEEKREKDRKRAYPRSRIITEDHIDKLRTTTRK